MRIFLEVKIALLPFAILFALAALGRPELAVVAGILLFAALFGWRLYTRNMKFIETGALVLCVGLGVALFVAPLEAKDNMSALALGGLGGVSLLSVGAGRAWTADYSGRDYADVEASPIFRIVNNALSGMWGGLFLLLAVLSFFHAGPTAKWSVVAFGAMASIFGPKYLPRWLVSRALTKLESFHWPAPVVGRGGPGPELDVAVVGAGIGGLTSAALLADAGLKVAVYEQHVVPGGFCHTFLRKAQFSGQPCVYRFDAGPHDFSGVWPGGPLTSVLERLSVADRISWRRLDHTFRFNGVSVDVPRDWQAYGLELARLFPGSAQGFESLFIDIRAIYDAMFATGVGRAGIPGMPSTVDEMLAFPRAHPFAFNWLERPFGELVGKHIADPDAQKILNALTGYISDGSEILTCAQMAPLFGYFIHGGFYPMGGSGRFADILTEAIEERGGVVQLKSPVQRISVENGRATGLVLANGAPVPAKAVISNADLKRACLDMVGAQHLAKDFVASLNRAEPACSAFLVQLGVDFVPDTNPTLHVEGDPSIGISILSLADPSAAPVGHATMSLICLLSHEDAASWFPDQAPRTSVEDLSELRRSPGYLARKKDMGDRMIRAAESVFPNLSSHIVHRSEASPVTFARYDWTSSGAIYGVSRQGRIKGSRGPLPGLYIAGSATHGAGIEAAVISGALAAESLLPGLLAKSGAPPSSSMLVDGLSPVSRTGS